MQVGNASGNNPGQAIYDALSDEAKAAVDALPSSLFDNSTAFADRCVETIRKIDSLRPANWALLIGEEGKGQFYRNITMNDKIVLGLYKDTISVTCEQSMLPEHFRTVLHSLSAEVSLPYKDQEVAFVKLSVAELGNLPTELWDAQSRLLERFAAMNYARSAFHYMHRDDARIKLSMAAGEEVPVPEYVPLERIGLPMTPTTTPNIELQHTLDTGFTSAGLTYTPTQIASFYTALQTKGFVILSGISGTGKSKIAQRFTEMLPDAISTTDLPLAEDFVRIAVKPYMKKYKRIRLWNEVSAGLPVPSHGSSVNVPFSIDSHKGICRVWNRPELKAGTYLFPQGDLGDVFKSLEVDVFALRFVIDAEQDRIASIEMRTELPTESEPAGSVGAKMSNRRFLPVRPDWRDGKALIGFHNPLSGEYVSTDFLEFVIAAGDDFRAGNRNAFFVILDEMNLAHVEYYFADVLSVIESGRDNEGWTVEGIPLDAGEEDADLPERLHLPPNLYIVGTVNMDETTYPFSAKVLDRAFTIELTEVDFTGYPPEHPGELEIDDGEKQALLQAFTHNGRYPRIDKSDIRSIVEKHDRYRNDLQSLNTSLRRSRMHFGYRVFDEIMQFVHNAELNELFTSDESFDHAVLMKVLPKFNGSRGKLQSAMFELIHWCRSDGTLTSEGRNGLDAQLTSLMDEGRPFDSIVIQGEDGIDDNWRYPATGQRAALMMQDLYTDGFASFG